MQSGKIFAGILSAGIMLSLISPAVMAAPVGWNGDNSNGWSYYTSDSDYVKDSWKEIDGAWYYFDDSGIAYQDCWQIINGKLYHFDKTCAMESNKWIDCGKSNIVSMAEEYCEDSAESFGYWSQFLDEDIHDWRYVGSDGAAFTGWRVVNGKWYLFNNSVSLNSMGLMSYGVESDENGDFYIFDRNGQYQRNYWLLTEQRWAYFGSNGIAYNDKWLKDNDKWYYFNENFFMISDCTDYLISGKLYDFDKNGVCLNPYSGRNLSGWVKIEDRWFYYSYKGELYKEWNNIGGKWYYFSPSDGHMVTGPQIINSKYYQFDDNGAMHTGWFRVPTMNNYYGKTYWFYCDKNGEVLAEQWLELDGTWYYFDTKDHGCCMISDVTDFNINGKLYDFDSSGACLNPYSGR